MAAGLPRVELIRLCETQHIDVVHLHNPAWMLYQPQPLVCMACAKKHSRYLDAATIAWPMTGHCAFVDYDSCAKWKTQCRQCPNQREYPTCIGLDGSARNHRLKTQAVYRAEPPDDCYAVPLDAEHRGCFLLAWHACARDLQWRGYGKVQADCLGYTAAVRSIRQAVAALCGFGLGQA